LKSIKGLTGRKTSLEGGGVIKKTEERERDEGVLKQKEQIGGRRPSISGGASKIEWGKMTSTNGRLPTHIRYNLNGPGKERIGGNEV